MPDVSAPERCIYDACTEVAAEVVTMTAPDADPAQLPLCARHAAMVAGREPEGASA